MLEMLPSIILRMIRVVLVIAILLLHLTARSPVFTHLSASLHGLSTIRAFKKQSDLVKEFDTHQDLHTASWYMFIMTNSAFGLSLDAMCVTLLLSTTFYFMVLGDSI